MLVLDYGLGFPKESPWRMKISESILILQENGELSELYHKWWRLNKNKVHSKCDYSIYADSKNNSSQLKMKYKNKQNSNNKNVILFI